MGSSRRSCSRRPGSRSRSSRRSRSSGRCADGRADVAWIPSRRVLCDPSVRAGFVSVRADRDRGGLDRAAADVAADVVAILGLELQRASHAARESARTHSRAPNAGLRTRATVPPTESPHGRTGAARGQAARRDGDTHRDPYRAARAMRRPGLLFATCPAETSRGLAPCLERGRVKFETTDARGTAAGDHVSTFVGCRDRRVSRPQTSCTT
jgi:hypothetical protein